MSHHDYVGKPLTNAVGSYGPIGISLRDYFAAHAPEATKDWIEHQQAKECRANPLNEIGKPKRHNDIELDAIWRYIWADAMLAAREKGALQ